MKSFESFLSGQMEAFIAYREQLGYSTKSIRASLSAFDRYLVQQSDQDAVWQPMFHLKLRKELNQAPSSINLVLYAARCFFEYLKRTRQCHSNPLQDVPQLPTQAFIPFVFSSEQTNQLLDVVCKQIRKDRRYFLKDLSDYLAILLLVRCGLRINEPLRLKLKHYRPEEKTIYIEKTKFKKDRLIPIPRLVAEQIDNYLSVRATLSQSHPDSLLLIGNRQETLDDQRIRYLFHKARKRIGIERPRQVIGRTIFGQPRPHSLRHSFAIDTLRSAVARGQSAQNVLPVLAAYLGHVEYRHTMKYLKVIDAQSGNRLLNFAGTQREDP
jgi:site-specific recombinase XerD